MLVIRRDLVDEIVAHAREEHPHEACGLIAGAEGAERPERVIRMVNAAKPSGDEDGEARERAHRDVLLGEHGEYRGEARSSTTYYAFDPAEYLRVQRELDGRDEWAVVNYHSHTRSEAYPSVVDTELASGPASDPRIHYVIVSTRSEDEECARTGSWTAWSPRKTSPSSRVMPSRATCSRTPARTTCPTTPDALPIPFPTTAGA